jgi:lipoyl(octanoyl) transferase
MWNRLPFLVLPGTRNMALDAWLLKRASATGEAHLRFYLWTRPTLSLGRSQTEGDVVDYEFCRSNGIDIVRRPTGGRAVLHHMELTYAVAGIFGRDHFPGGVQETYGAVCEALCAGLNALGVPAVMWEGGTGARLPTPKTLLPCFAAPVPGEIAAGGKKLVGSAMRADGGAFLQHGSLLIGIDSAMQRGAQRDKSDYPAAFAMEWLHPCPSWGRMLGALGEGFRSRFGTGMAPFSPSPAEWEGIRAGAADYRVSAAGK